jgi:hypothetical protein
MPLLHLCQRFFIYRKDSQRRPCRGKTTCRHQKRYRRNPVDPTHAFFPDLLSQMPVSLSPPLMEFCNLCDAARETRVARTALHEYISYSPTPAATGYIKLSGL